MLCVRGARWRRTQAVDEAGRVIERGTHTELLRRRGHYYKLYQQQFAELVPA